VDEAPPRIAPAALAARLDRTTGGSGGPVLVDVRTPAERATGIVPGSIPPDDLAADDDRPVVVVCASGVRATAWARAARAAGRDATVLDGGIQAWDREGLPTIRPTATADADTIER
jgi:adenylyltransferase/sulfurtransferase